MALLERSGFHVREGVGLLYIGSFSRGISDLVVYFPLVLFESGVPRGRLAPLINPALRVDLVCVVLSVTQSIECLT